MLLAHARVLTQARSYLAALADSTGTVDASLAYDGVLLELDAVHGDDTPALSAVPPADRHALRARAEAALESLLAHGVDALQVELLLAALEDARSLDVP
jgi:hypothetical protein